MQPEGTPETNDAIQYQNYQGIFGDNWTYNKGVKFYSPYQWAGRKK